MDEVLSLQTVPKTNGIIGVWKRVEDGSGEECYEEDISVPQPDIPIQKTSIDWRVENSGTVNRYVDQITLGGRTISLSKTDYSKLTGVTLLPDSCLVGYSQGDNKTISFSDSFDHNPERLFQGNSTLESVIMPDSIQSIGRFAFKNCTSLKTIRFSNSLYMIDSHAFENCTALENIVLPNSLRELENDVFTGCTSIEELTIPISTNAACYWAQPAFGRETNIKKIIFSKGRGRGFDYEHDPEESFHELYPSTPWYLSKAPSLEIIFSEGIGSIGSYMFFGCNNIKNITIPKSVSNIRSSAFACCNSLTAINVEEGSQHFCSVDGVLFNKNKTRLVQYPAGKPGTSYIIPDSVKSIAPSAFYGCTNLKSIVMPDKVTTIGAHAFSNCSSLTTINISKSLSEIKGFTFAFCNALAEMEIPDSVTSISSEAFRGCESLKKVIIPSSVTSVGASAFACCKSLTEIENHSSIPVEVTYYPVYNEFTNRKRLKKMYRW